MSPTAFKIAILACVFSLSLALESDAQIIIDAFDQGPVELFGDSSGTHTLVTGLDEGRTLGGLRSTWVRSVTPPPTGLTIYDGGIPGLVMTVPALSEGAIQIGYGGSLGDPPLDEDFYANDQAGFEFIFDEAPIGSRFYLIVNTSTGGQYFSDYNLMLSGPGAYRIPYTEVVNEFGPDSVDMNFASGLAWGIWDLPSYPSETKFSVSSLRTYSIPEPGCVWIFGLFGFATAVRRAPRHLR